MMQRDKAPLLPVLEKGRETRRGRWLALALISALFIFRADLAAAHGGLSMDQDQCKLRIGPYFMHFTGYQPEATSEKEFCEDIPATGHTVFALDAVDNALREMPLEVRIIRDTGDERNLDAITIFRIPPKVYPTGSVSFEHLFDQPGKFVGLVTVTDNKQQQHLSRFPFAVGGDGWSKYTDYLVIPAVLLLGAGLYLYAGRKRRAPKMGAE